MTIDIYVTVVFVSVSSVSGVLLVLSDLPGHSSVLPSIGSGCPSFLSPLFPSSSDDSDGD